LRVGSVLVGLALAVSVLILAHRFSNTSEATLNLRIAYPEFQPASFYDPSKIDTARQANILRNIYSRLVEFDKDGNLVGGVAKSFEWIGDSVVFEFRDGLRTIDGRQIGAEDAAVSLKRLIVLGKNTHGEIANFLCANDPPRTIGDSCKGIRVDGNKLVLTLEAQEKRPFFVPILASLDFAVIPKDSIDLSDSKLPIVDYRNTSGPYFIETDSAGGAFVLAVNPSHFNFSKDIAQKIEVVPAAGSDATEKFKNGEVDLITTVDATPFLKLVELAEQTQGGGLHRTHNIRLLMVAFTEKGRRDLSLDERICVAQSIRESSAAILKNEGFQSTKQFFPVLGAGSLDETQLADLEHRHARPAGTCKSIRIGFKPAMPSQYRELLRASGNSIVDLKSAPWRTPIEEQPDAYLDLTDSSFYEDFSLISYSIASGVFSERGEKSRAWLNSYMETESKAERLLKLRKLHFDSIAEVRVIPLGFAPYVAVARAPWKFEFSKFYAGTPLWQLKNK
jgi:hypothetical protein